MTKLFPTSTAGSLPKPSWLAQPEQLWSPWKLEGEALAAGKNDALRVTLQEQEKSGKNKPISALIIPTNVTLGKSKPLAIICVPTKISISLF